MNIQSRGEKKTLLPKQKPSICSRFCCPASIRTDIQITSILGIITLASAITVLVISYSNFQQCYLFGDISCEFTNSECTERGSCFDVVCRGTTNNVRACFSGSDDSSSVSAHATDYTCHYCQDGNCWTTVGNGTCSIDGINAGQIGLDTCSGNMTQIGGYDGSTYSTTFSCDYTAPNQSLASVLITLIFVLIIVGSTFVIKLLFCGKHTYAHYKK